MLDLSFVHLHRTALLCIYHGITWLIATVQFPIGTINKFRDLVMPFIVGTLSHRAWFWHVTFLFILTQLLYRLCQKFQTSCIHITAIDKHSKYNLTDSRRSNSVSRTVLASLIFNQSKSNSRNRYITSYFIIFQCAVISRAPAQSSERNDGIDDCFRDAIYASRRATGVKQARSSSDRWWSQARGQFRGKLRNLAARQTHLRFDLFTVSWCMANLTPEDGFSAMDSSSSPDKLSQIINYAVYAKHALYCRY